LVDFSEEEATQQAQEIPQEALLGQPVITQAVFSVVSLVELAQDQQDQREALDLQAPPEVVVFSVAF
jgi:hypothetical protein